MQSKDSYIGRTSGIGLTDKVGYAMGDMANLFVFSLVTTLLQVYYTDLLHIAPALILILFTVARIWDAVNDPMWGVIVDMQRAGKGGRYRPWLLRMSVPVALAAVLMFVKIPGLTSGQYFAYACVTYIAFGMLYTAVNIPYGSMASVITTDDRERSSLSVFRSVGSIFGNLPSIIMASICYITIVASDGSKSKVLDYGKLITGVCITAVLCVAAYIACYAMSKERVPAPPAHKRARGETMAVIKGLFKNRAFLSMCSASMLLIAAQMFTQGYYVYLFKDYFGSPALYPIVLVCQYLPVAVLMFFSGKICARFGRKEVCALGMLLAGAANLVLYFLHTSDPVVFLVVCFISGIGSTFFFLQVWALVTDVIDDCEMRTGKREEATSYAFYSFARKLGQTVAGILANAALIWIGYNELSGSQTGATADGMYSLAVLIPAILYLLMAAALWFWYPLGKEKLKELQAQKEVRLRAYFESDPERGKAD
jgi:GPH family glycoside/pentoside/hexuronide:cation symporter